MTKRIYSQFENDKVVAISLGMGNDHLAVYSRKFNIDLEVLIEMRDVTKAKSVYINLDSEYLICYKDKDNHLRLFPTYVQFIEQNFKMTFLYSLKPLGTPKLPKPRKHIELPVVLEVDSILDKISKYVINFITKEEKEFLDKL